MNTKLRRRWHGALLTVLVLGHPGGAWGGDLNGEVNSMFNALGGMGNYTPPGAFHGQAMNTLSGGSLEYRVPVKRYQLMTLEWPYVHASCNGISAYGGAFSFLSGTALRDMIKKITSALPAVAFQLALDAVSPLFGGLTKHFKGLENSLSIASQSSCEIAQALVGKAAAAAGLSADTICHSVASATAAATDWADGIQLCDEKKAEVLASARSSDDPQIASQVPFTGNLVWEALSPAAGTPSDLDRDERELVMNLIGTVIYYPPETNKTPLHLEPTITQIRQLLYGDELDASADGMGAKVEWWSCDEETHCANPTKVSKPFKPMSTRVGEYMNTLISAIRERSAIPNHSPEVGFVNVSSLPVYRMLSLVTMGPDTGLAASLVAQYQNVLAVDFAYQLLAREYRIGLDALNQRALLDRSQVADNDLLQRRVSELKTALVAEKTSQYARVQTVETMNSRLEALERQMRRNMPDQVMAILGRANPVLR